VDETVVERALAAGVVRHQEEKQFQMGFVDVSQEIFVAFPL
jgi:hypothetical protein